ncbi:hypothetical protein RYJ27_00755 [Microbacterium limosum]|uniref:Uncharacterized protein n=1 Tax=Microbacterium limosum TaxID=3079935 RepID=A0AAU0MGW6_9MICO|nr:hypothetical protein [Microbacterium sp. Y20]WOQ69813.1 hypothetical protein RYJ27_00755 [Microbacterium sp. Y20]
MALFRRRRHEPYAALSEEERMSRYVYLLNTLPAEVIEKAHEAAFRELSVRERREMFDRLRPFMSVEEQAGRPRPALMAGVLRRISGVNGGTTVRERDGSGTGASTGAGTAEDPRRAFEDSLQANAITAAMAQHFILSAVVVSYFAHGAGAGMLAAQPAWVSDLAATDAAGAGHAGGYGGEHSAGYGDGGGYDGGFGGGFGGGFDAGGGFA